MSNTVSCWQCGADLPDPEARFCPACGAALAKPTFWETFARRRGWLWTLLGVILVGASFFGLRWGLPRLRGRQVISTAATLVAPGGLPSAPVILPTDTAALAPTLTPRPPEPTAEPTAEPSPEPSATADLDALLLDAANRFQQAKADSQATGDTSRLGEVLAGDALARQIELVNQWKDQGCSWEITLDEPLTIRVLETRDGRWARIEVAKVETRRLTCGGELESATEGDAYTTTYVVEEIDGVWKITERE